MKIIFYLFLYVLTINCSSLKNFDEKYQKNNVELFGFKKSSEIEKGIMAYREIMPYG